MKILMSLFSRRFEGTYYRAYPWARALAQNGHAVTLICVSPSRRLTSESVVEHGVRIIETPNLLDGRRSLRRLCGMSGWGPLDVMCRLQELRKGDYDVVHLFEHHMNIALPVYLSPRRHMPLLVADWCDHYGPGGFRDQGARPRLHRLYKPLGAPVRAGMDYLERDLRVRADGVTVISNYLRTRAIELGVTARRVVRIPGSADIDTVTPQAKGSSRIFMGIRPQAPVIAFFGASLMDLEFLLSSFLHVLESNPDATLLLLGRSTPESERTLKHFGLDGNVLRTGWIPDDRIAAWLACADVMALPMTDTPVNQARWPNKIGFHMAAGRPTVCTAIGDVAELVSRETIGLVSQVTARDFGASIVTLLNAPSMAARMGRKARQVAEQQFDIRSHVQDLEDAYQSFARRRMQAPAAEHTEADTLQRAVEAIPHATAQRSAQ